MVRSWLRRAAVFAPLAALVVGVSTPATADGAADGPAAVLSNSLQLSTDAADNANESTRGSDNITCDVPKVYGGPINQRTPYVVGEIYGQDFATGGITCMSLDPSSRFSLSVTVYIEAFDGYGWTPVASGSRSMSAEAGAATAYAVALGQYPAFSSALNKYHRGYLVATTSTGRVYRTPTPAVWYMAA